MNTMHRDPLTEDYVRRLRAAAAGLPRERRDELVAEIEEHIDAALREGDDNGEAAVRNVLERLGPPEEIAAAAGPPPERPGRGRLETTAMIVLAASFALPVAGYLLGAGLVISSRAWAARDKLVGLVIPPLIVLLGGGLIVAIAAGPAEGDTFSSGLGPLEITVLMADLFSGVIAAAYLASRLSR
jgi:HAAS domain-containing protein